MSKTVHDEKRGRVEKDEKQKSRIDLDGRKGWFDAREFGSTRRPKISSSESVDRVEKTRHRSRSPSHHKRHRSKDR